MIDDWPESIQKGTAINHSYTSIGESDIAGSSARSEAIRLQVQLAGSVGRFGWLCEGRASDSRIGRVQTSSRLTWVCLLLLLLLLLTFTGTVCCHGRLVVAVSQKRSSSVFPPGEFH